MSAYDERPWLALYGDQSPDYTLEFHNALDMFKAGVERDPDGVALQYFDGSITRRELDELSDGLASGLLASGFAPGDRLAVYLQNGPPFVIYTSGTTGVPKGARNTHRNVVFTARGYRDCVRAGRDGAIFGIAPLFHITGLIGHIAVSMLAPAPLVLAYRFEPQVVLDALLEHRPTFTIGALTALNALLNAPGFTKDHFASITSEYSGGAAISPP